MSADSDMRDLAKFPEENPNPVLRIADDGRVIYANAGSTGLLSSWGCGVGDVAPNPICAQIERARSDDEERSFEFELADGARIWLEVAPVQGEDYVNVYGRDISKIRKIERLLANHSDALRSPLTRILGASDPLIEAAGSTGNSALATDLDELREAGRAVLALLDDIGVSL